MKTPEELKQSRREKKAKENAYMNAANYGYGYFITSCTQPVIYSTPARPIVTSTPKRNGLFNRLKRWVLCGRSSD